MQCITGYSTMRYTAVVYGIQYKAIRHHTTLKYTICETISCCSILCKTILDDARLWKTMLDYTGLAGLRPPHRGKHWLRPCGLAAKGPKTQTRRVQALGCCVATRYRGLIEGEVRGDGGWRISARACSSNHPLHGGAL